MKILVTGTAGFMGFHLAKVANSGCETNFPRKKLLQRGDEVVDIDNINDYYDVNLKYARLNELGIDALGCDPLGSPSGLIDDFGYKPDTDLKDGIGEFVTWYRGFYRDDK